MEIHDSLATLLWHLSWGKLLHLRRHHLFHLSLSALIYYREGVSDILTQRAHLLK